MENNYKDVMWSKKETSKIFHNVFFKPTLITTFPFFIKCIKTWTSINKNHTAMVIQNFLLLLVSALIESL